MGFDYKKCTGLKVKPRKGDGLLFYSVFPNGTIDQVNIFSKCAYKLLFLFSYSLILLNLEIC